MNDRRITTPVSADGQRVQLLSAPQESETRHTNTVLHGLFRHVAGRLAERFDEIEANAVLELETLRALAGALGEPVPTDLPVLTQSERADAWENASRAASLLLIDILTSRRGVWQTLSASEWSAHALGLLTTSRLSEFHEDTGLEMPEMEVAVRVAAHAITDFEWFGMGEKLQSSRGELLVQTDSEDHSVSWFYTSHRIFGLLSATTGPGQMRTGESDTIDFAERQVDFLVAGTPGGHLPPGPSTHAAHITGKGHLVVRCSSGIVAHPIPEGYLLEGKIGEEQSVAEVCGEELSVEFVVAKDGTGYSQSVRALVARP